MYLKKNEDYGFLNKNNSDMKFTNIREVVWQIYNSGYTYLF